jgi:predicted PurR-regulated permease PerM
MMAEPTPPVVTPPSRPGQPAFFWLASLALIVTILARAQTILVPLALAIVVAFALNPSVRRIERVLGRGLAVGLVVLIALGAVTAFGYLLKRQLVDLSAQMTKYSDSIRTKVVALRGSTSGGLSGLSKSVDRVVRELDEQVPADVGARPVRVIPAEATATERIESTLAPVVEPLTRSVIVLVLVIFLLLRREDLRDRFIRLIGRGNVTLTTRTLDEAGHRISRFLTHQSAINAGFGVIVSIGLFAIGIPYGPLWGFLAAVLRFVPFVGTLLAMLLPATLAFAQFAGWWQMLATLGLFMGLDAIAAYLVEPIVIGGKTGVSSMAMLVSAIFWSWLWGPIGLVLSTPMTVCLAVLGKHVPRLSYLAVLLGDEPALEDELVLYQRLLAGDEDEAQDILEKSLRASSPGPVFDDVVVPVLLFAARDRARHEISELDYQTVLRAIRVLVDAAPGIAAAGSPALSPAAPTGADADAIAPAPVRVLGISARNAGDEIVWEMMAQLFDAKKVHLESAGSAYLASEVTAVAEDRRPDVVCVIATPPGGLAQARYICRRLRAKLPDTPIVVIRPGIPPSAREGARKLTADGATAVAFSVEEGHSTTQGQLAIRTAAPATPGASARAS